MEGIAPFINAFIESALSNKLFLGVCMVFSNIGGRFLMQELKASEEFFQHPWARKLAVFFLVLVATKDIIVSLLVLLVYILLFTHPYRYASKFSRWLKKGESIPPAPLGGQPQGQSSNGYSQSF